MTVEQAAETLESGTKIAVGAGESQTLDFAVTDATLAIVPAGWVSHDAERVEE